MWRDKYKIGIEKIDEQHEKFFCIISEFLFLLRMKGNWEDKIPKVKETLEFTQNYFVIHCEEEESYQKEINYPELINHKELHDQLKHEMCMFSEQFNNEGYNEVLAQKFASKLLYWLLNHVGLCDKQMAYFANDILLTH
jgi:hemerythrin